MVSKNQQKKILQLKQKKYRNKFGLFVAEGDKVTNELLNSSFECKYLFSTKKIPNQKANQVTSAEMKQLSHFKNPSSILAVFKIPDLKLYKQSNLTIVLDGISDPGNLGTIIRLCDWFGLEELICSSNTVDCFNPKVIQSSMGSIARVNCYYTTDLLSYINSLDKPIYGAEIYGSSIYKNQLPVKATYIFGSESHGISKELKKKLNYQIGIPNFKKNNGAESLNVASSVAIFFSEIYRTI